MASLAVTTNICKSHTQNAIIHSQFHLEQLGTNTTPLCVLHSIRDVPSCRSRLFPYYTVPNQIKMAWMEGSVFETTETTDYAVVYIEYIAG